MPIVDDATAKKIHEDSTKDTVVINTEIFVQMLYKWLPYKNNPVSTKVLVNIKKCNIGQYPNSKLANIKCPPF